MANTIKTRLWTNIALIAGVAILALILWLNPGKIPQQSVPLSTLNKSEVKSIEIFVGAKPPVKLKKRNGDWQLVEPFNITANTSRVNAVLNLLTTYAVSQYPAAELNLEEFGLLPPEAVIRFDQAEFDFGGTDPLNRKRYVLHNRTLYLIEDFVYPLLNTNIGGLVSQKLVPATNLVTGFELTGFSLSRTSSGWDIQPPSPRLSTDNLQEWVNEWLNTQAILVQHRPLSALESQQFVTVRFEHGGNIRYRILDADDESALYRADLGLLYSLSRTTFNSLITRPLPLAEEFDPGSMIKVDALPPGASAYDRQGWRKCRLCRSTLSARPSLDIVDALPPGASTYRPSLDIVSAD